MSDVLRKLAEPFPPEEIKWRQDGEPWERDGKQLARFVPFVDAHAVRVRLDAAAFALWEFHLAELPALEQADRKTGQALPPVQGLRGILEIERCTREDVGQGKDYKTAASDAFKRAAQRFGIGGELHTLPRLVIEVQRQGKYWKPAEDPSSHYQRTLRGGARQAPHEQRKQPLPAAAPAKADPPLDLQQQRRAEEARKDPADRFQLDRLRELAENPNTPGETRTRVLHALNVTGVSRKTGALWIDTMESQLTGPADRKRMPPPDEPELPINDRRASD